MSKWAINILNNASKKSAHRRQRLFKYFEDNHNNINIENNNFINDNFINDNFITGFNSKNTFKSVPSNRTYDIEAQAFIYTKNHMGRLVYEDLTVDEDFTVDEDLTVDEDFTVDEYDYEYERIDWYM